VYIVSQPYGFFRLGCRMAELASVGSSTAQEAQPMVPVVQKEGRERQSRTALN